MSTQQAADGQTDKPVETTIPPPATQAVQPPQEKRTTMPNKNKRSRPSEETVLSRARRLLRSEMKPLAHLLGLEQYDKDTVMKKLTEIKEAKDAGLSAGDRSDRRLKELEVENRELQSKLQIASGESQKLKLQVTSGQRELQNLKIEHEVRSAAHETGVRDTDYGLHLFKQYVRGNKDEQIQSAKDYFEGLKKDTSKRALFTEEKVPAGPPSLAETTAVSTTTTSPQSTSPAPTAAPKPATPGSTKQDQTTALDMNKRDFNNHTAEKYGFRPSMI